MKKTFNTEEIMISNGIRRIFGKLYIPEGEEKCPAVILSHGYNGTHADFARECEYFASNGMIALAYDFCGGSVNSRSSGKSTDMTIFTEKEDLMCVLDYITGMDRADSNHIFLMGGSQGGLVTALAGAECKNKVRGLILYYPAFCIPDNWRENYPTQELIPETVDFWGLTLGKEFFMSIRTLEPYRIIGDFDKDVLIIHGDEDAIVPLSYSLKAREIYENAALVILPKEAHGFSPERGVEAAEMALLFIKHICKRDVLSC